MSWNVDDLAGAPCSTHWLAFFNAFGKWRWKNKWNFWLVAIDTKPTNKKGAGLEPKALPFKPGHSYCAHAQKPFRFLPGSICCACDSFTVQLFTQFPRLGVGWITKGLPPQHFKTTGRALIASRLPGYLSLSHLNQHLKHIRLHSHITRFPPQF